MTIRSFSIGVLAALLTLTAWGSFAAPLEVVATSPSMGALARSIGADRTRVTVLASPDRDLHMLQAKPTMIRALRDADLVVAIGAELEIGWLPMAIGSAANPRVLPGQPGYFEAAAQVDLLDVGAPADRAQGDVHPVGNPHVNMDPERMVQIAQALAAQLARLDPAGADTYQANAEHFALAVAQRMPIWQEQLAGAPGAVLYHRDAVYLLDRFNVPLLGTLEEIPGVPPTARHVKALQDQLQGRSGIIIYAPYQSVQAPNRLARELGWEAVSLTLEPPMNAAGSDYLDHIDRWVLALSQPQ
ncbi:zinc ABC transporter substrate-binding protein [Thiocapsa imhoffii]|uniref:Zinc ABC transporter substrate-binding protein n=1 Tax=Thiocapsa imhoffii TaxID=382777 RepID=A0A9X0WHZ1_9GAMM|nr:metal ABC transporter substrate-binding protein [Thiocapsa imhoffii]MBK1644634.1 zinc ABC transporter substrate-binding protein [Thiocapsa imhoffii]